MVAYLFGETAKNFYLIHHTDEWIEYVTRSQRGDCCLEILPELLPSREEMERELDWEQGLVGPELMDRWLERHAAAPFDFDRGLDDNRSRRRTRPSFTFWRARASSAGWR
jgi:hypothetical protein